MLRDDLRCNINKNVPDSLFDDLEYEYINDYSHCNSDGSYLSDDFRNYILSQFCESYGEEFVYYFVRDFKSGRFDDYENYYNEEGNLL